MTDHSNASKISLKEIAAKAGVSIGTVHRAIYGKPGLSEKTRGRILAIVEAENYQINSVASMMKRGAMRIVVVLPAGSREDRFFFRGVWKGVRRAAENLARYKLQFEFVEAGYRLDKMANALKELFDTRSEPMDGLITIADTVESEEWVSRFSRRGVPVVLVASYEQTASCIASVKTDHTVCGSLAAEFFSFALTDAKPRILLLPGQLDSHSNQLYARGFTERLSEVLPDSSLMRIDGIGKHSVAEKVRDMLTLSKPDAVFACNARNSFLVCEILQSLNLKNRPLFVGSDVFSEIAPYFESNILSASIYQFHCEQGVRAVELLYEHLSGNAVRQSDMILPAALVMRSNYKFFIS